MMAVPPVQHVAKKWSGCKAFGTGIDRPALRHLRRPVRNQSPASHTQPVTAIFDEECDDRVVRRNIPVLPAPKAWRFVKSQAKPAKLLDKVAQLEKSESSAHDSEVLHTAIPDSR